ncbi:hypothetical protein QOZ80_3AG0222540 [Eleusine coracana subsp. coracana]|nr:hypothetical protein QOZ80_3AG0222540 [Eleusine coracana subsp. coracana]
MEPVGGGAREEEARNGGGASSRDREYRRGNWTVAETMVLIEAKRKVHEEGEQGLSRWRWVEDYCWRAGCRRSESQCNDRWDNLMRHYKKVRAHELGRRGEEQQRQMSYWAMGRAERKERGLPGNLLREVYEGMAEVVERKKQMMMGCSSFVGAAASSSSIGFLDDVPVQASPLAQVLPPPLLPHLDLEQAVVTRGGVPHYCSPESPERKRRRASLDERRPPPESSGTPASGPPHFHHQEEDDHSDEMMSSDDDEEGEILSGAIGRCAAILSEALESREAAKERRHRELVAAAERRGRAAQARREAGEQCVARLAAAVSQLAGSMLALAAAKQGGPGPGPAKPK